MILCPEKSGPPFSISIPVVFAGKFLIKPVKMALLLIKPKSDIQTEGFSLLHGYAS